MHQASGRTTGNSAARNTGQLVLERKSVAVAVEPVLPSRNGQTHPGVGTRRELELPTGPEHLLHVSCMSSAIG